MVNVTAPGIGGVRRRVWPKFSIVGILKNDRASKGGGFGLEIGLHKNVVIYFSARKKVTRAT